MKRICSYTLIALTLLATLSGCTNNKTKVSPSATLKPSASPSADVSSPLSPNVSSSPDGAESPDSSVSVPPEARGILGSGAGAMDY